MRNVRKISHDIASGPFQPVPLENLSRITLADLNKISDANKASLSNSIMSDEKSRAQIKYNKQLIKMLKVANSNLQQYKEIM